MRNVYFADMEILSCVLMMELLEQGSIFMCTGHPACLFINSIVSIHLFVVDYVHSLHRIFFFFFSNNPSIINHASHYFFKVIFYSIQLLAFVIFFLFFFRAGFIVICLVYNANMMQINKNVKFYEQKLVTAHNRIYSLESKQTELQVKIQQLTEQTHQLDTKLINAQHTIAQLESQNKNLRNDRKCLHQEFNNGQKKQKILYDYAYVDGGYCNVDRINSLNVQFVNRINSLQQVAQGETISKYQEVIAQQQSQLKKVMDENSKLKKEILRVTCQYQEKIAELTEDNVRMKSSNSSVEKLKKKVEQIVEKEYDEGILKSTEENLQIAFQLIEKYENQIFDLEFAINEKINEANNNKSGKKALKKTPEVEQYLKTKRQNKQLKEELNRFQQYQEAITLAYPEFYQYQDAVTKTAEEVKELGKLRYDIENLKGKVKVLQNELLLKTNLASKYQKDLSDEQIARRKEKNLIRGMIQKYNSYFLALDPKFAAIEEQNLGLTEEEKKRINQRPRNFIEKEKRELENTKSQLQLQKIQTKKQNREIFRLRSMIANMRYSIKKLTKLNKIKTQNSSYFSAQGMIEEAKVQTIMKMFKIVQEERNELMMKFREGQITIMELMAQNANLRECQEYEAIVINDQVQRPKQSAIQVKYLTYNTESIAPEISVLKSQLHEAIQKVKQNQEDIVKEYCEKIRELKRQLASKSIEKQSDIQEHAPPQEEQLQQPMIEYGDNRSEISIEEDSIVKNEKRNSALNLMNEQSIKFLDQLLKDHETSLQKILSQFYQLRTRYIQLEGQKVLQNSKAEQYQQLESDYEALFEKRQVALSRLNEADKNQATFHSLLEEKTQQLSEYKQKIEIKIKALQQTIEVLEKENVQLKQNIYAQQDAKLQSLNTESNVVEVEMLLSLLTQKNNEIKALKASEEKKKVLQPIDTHTEMQSLRQKQINELEKIIDEGELVELIEGAIYRIKNSEQ